MITVTYDAAHCKIWRPDVHVCASVFICVHVGGVTEHEHARTITLYICRSLRVKLVSCYVVVRVVASECGYAGVHI